MIEAEGNLREAVTGERGIDAGKKLVSGGKGWVSLSDKSFLPKNPRKRV